MTTKFVFRPEDTRSFQIRSSATSLQAAFPVVTADQFSLGYDSFLLDIDFTDITGGTNVTFTIQYYDEASASYKTLLAGAAITADNTHQRLIVSPHIPAATNVVAQVPAPRRWRVSAAETGTITSATWSMAVSYF